MPAKRPVRTKRNTPEKPALVNVREAKGKATPAGSQGERLRLAPVPQAAPAPDPKLASIVHGKILRAIIHGPLDLGEPLSENDLARALGVSKAPVRESLNELRLEGLVVVIPQSGSYVFSPTREQIRELCDFRSLLETCALRASMKHAARPLLTELRRSALAMKHALRRGDALESKRLDTEFHCAIVRHSGNRYLVQCYTQISHSVEALRYRCSTPAPYGKGAYEEHQEIVELLSKDHVTSAVGVLRNHIARTKRVQTRLSWTSGRLSRKDYRFRDYSTIFAERAL